MKKTCGNCACVVIDFLDCESPKCDITEKYINYTDTCDQWYPNMENEVVILRKENAELQKQVESMQWIPVGERLPTNTVKGKYIDLTIVLCTDGKNWYKAYYAKKREFNCDDYGWFEGETEEGDDGKEYWPEGWYECAGDNDDTDWVLGVKITHWMPLPKSPMGECSDEDLY